MHGTHRATRQEYAIKVLDKGHLKRNNKLNTALAEKNTLVRLGSGHPGIVRLHWAFQDDWSLCESLSLFCYLALPRGRPPYYGGLLRKRVRATCRLGFIPPLAS
jgi:serine/threonine protein kinase